MQQMDFIVNPSFTDAYNQQRGLGHVLLMRSIRHDIYNKAAAM